MHDISMENESGKGERMTVKQCKGNNITRVKNKKIGRTKCEMRR